MAVKVREKDNEREGPDMLLIFACLLIFWLFSGSWDTKPPPSPVREREMTEEDEQEIVITPEDPMVKGLIDLVAGYVVRSLTFHDLSAVFPGGLPARLCLSIRLSCGLFYFLSP